MSQMSKSSPPLFWPLKNKSGKPPPSDDCIWKAIAKLDRGLLFPCSRSVNDLEMQKQDKPPREMNSFMVFRRHLSFFVKQENSLDGKILSRLASYIWNGASKSEKANYSKIAVELKQRHYKKYPDYTYERRKRKTSDNNEFAAIEQEYDIQTVPAATALASTTSFQIPPQEGWSTTTALLTSQEDCSSSDFCSENEIMNVNVNELDFNINNLAFDFYNNQTFEPPTFTNIDDMFIPVITQRLLSLNYSDLNHQEIVQQRLNILPQQQQFQQQQYCFDTPYNNYDIYHGDSNAGMSHQNIDEMSLALAAPLDDVLNNINMNTIIYNQQGN